MKIITFVSSVLLSLNIIDIFLQDCVHGQRMPKIIGGIDSKPEDIKYLVSIQIRGWHVCGGAIIDDQFILTAGHCVINKANNQFKQGPWRIVGGTNDVNVSDSMVIIADVDKIFVPQSFHVPKTVDESWNADIAVLRLKQSLNLTSNPRLKKLNLATEPSSYTNVEATIAGFGWDTYKEIESPYGGSYIIHSISGKAHQINVTVLEHTECRKFSPTKLMNTELCARISELNADRPAGTCTGDSGSPMVYNDKVIGVMVRSKDPCDQNVQPAYYTKVSSYVDFIENARNNNVDDMRVIEV